MNDITQDGSDAAWIPDAVAMARIRALTAQYNAQRQDLAKVAWRRWWRYGLPLMAVCVGAAVFTLWQVEGNIDAPYVASFRAAVLAPCLAILLLIAFFIRRPTELADIGYRPQVQALLFSFLRHPHSYQGGQPSIMANFARTRLLSYSQSVHSETLTAEFKGLPVLVTATELLPPTLRVYNVAVSGHVFKGYLFRLPPPEGFSGILLIQSRSASAFHLPPDPLRGKAHVFKSGDVALDACMVFFSDRPDAHRVVATRLGKRLLDAMTAADAPLVHVAASETDCFVLVTSSRGILHLPPAHLPVDVDRHLLASAAGLYRLTGLATALRTAAVPMNPQDTLPA